MLDVRDFVASRSFRRHHDELREMWQGKALLAARGKTAAVLMSMLCHAYGDEALRTMLQVCFPGFVGIRPPFYASAGKVWYDGRIVADLVQRDNTKVPRALVYADMAALESDFRRLADDIRLSDADRADLFRVVKKWIVADFRRDPNRTVEAT